MTLKEIILRNKIYDLERALNGAKENLKVWQDNQKPNPDWDWLKNGDFNFDLVDDSESNNNKKGV